jgi:hypothetical protein
MERVYYPDGADPDCYARFSADAVGGGAVVEKTIKMPYATGDRLWVREAFAVSGLGWGKKPSQAQCGRVHYKADSVHGWQSYWGNWRPSIHMPRWASRQTLIVTDVRVQRLQDISEDDARAEGAKPWTGACQSYVTDFAAIWRAINGPDAWDANPWVAAISFIVQRLNIDETTT